MKHFKIGSVEWLVLLRQGAFDERPEPKKKLSPLAAYVGKPCPYCHVPMRGGNRAAHRATRDHVFPRWMGGRLSETNRLIVCYKCNHEKGSMTLEQFAAWLTSKGDERGGIVWNLVERHYARKRS